MIRRSKPIRSKPCSEKRAKRTMRSSLPRKRSKPRRGPDQAPVYRRWLQENGTCAACLAQVEMALAGRACEWEITSGALETLDARPAFKPGLCDPCHTQNNGMRSKGPGAKCAPLCRRHHLEYDAGREAFEGKYALDMEEIADGWYYAFERRREAGKDLVI